MFTSHTFSVAGAQLGSTLPVVVTSKDPLGCDGFSDFHCFWSPGKVVFFRILHCKVPSPSSSFFTLYSPHVNNEVLYLLFLKVNYLHKIFIIPQHGRFAFISHTFFIYSVILIYLYYCGHIDTYCILPYIMCSYV